MSAAPPTEPVTFESAIALTQEWLDRWLAGPWTPEQFAAAVAQLVATPAGARGFFVVYLTDERPLLDRPPADLVAALAQSPAIVLDLLVKNLAMSAAMAITHDRTGDAAMAERSRHTSQRSGDLLNRLDRHFTESALEPVPSVSALLSQLQSSITDQTGPFVAFLERWGYDADQQRAILRAIEHRGQVPGPARSTTQPA